MLDLVIAFAQGFFELDGQVHFCSRSEAQCSLDSRLAKCGFATSCEGPFSGVDGQEFIMMFA
jgi:hypothetical protein